jgi:hypothetical protein
MAATWSGFQTNATVQPTPFRPVASAPGAQVIDPLDIRRDTSVAPDSAVEHKLTNRKARRIYQMVVLVT